MKFDVVGRLLKLPAYAASEWEICTQGNSYCFPICTEKLLCCHALGCLWTNVLQTWYNNRCWLAVHFDMGLGDLDLHSRSQWSMKVNYSVPVNYWTKFSMDFDRIWYFVDTCGCSESHSHFSRSISVQGRWPCLGDFVGKKMSVWPVFQHLLTNSLKLGTIINTISSTLWCHLEWQWLSFKVTFVWESKDFCAHLLTNFQSIWMKFGSLA